MSKKIKPLPWIPLTEKEPPFQTDLVCWRVVDGTANTIKGYWLPCVLLEIRHTPEGKKFIFENQITKDQLDNFTHYLPITLPEV